MKIYLLLGHPDGGSFNRQLCDAYRETLLKAGHEVRQQQIGEMQFDPVLLKGYKVIQALEPDLKTAQENILWCEKWVIFYPIWWGSMPAILKGFFDRTLLPGFAFKYHDKGPFWDKLLKGRSTAIVTTCDAPKWWIWWQYRNSDLNAIKKATLAFCGFKPVRVLRIDRMRYRNEKQRAAALQAVRKFAEQH